MKSKWLSSEVCDKPREMKNESIWYLRQMLSKAMLVRDDVKILQEMNSFQRKSRKLLFNRFYLMENPELNVKRNSIWLPESLNIIFG